MVAYPLNRPPDFSHRVRFRRGVLRVRTARAASAHLDETDAAAAMFALARHWSFAQQRTRGPRSDLQP